jgi:signal transduction histidine kinase
MELLCSRPRSKRSTKDARATGEAGREYARQQRVYSINEAARCHDFRESSGRNLDDELQTNHLDRLSTFTASVTHELNQPLAAAVLNISCCLRLLAKDPSNVDRAREAAQRALQDCNRAAATIASLRSLYTIENLDCKDVNINDAVGQAVSSFSDQIKEHEVTLQCKLGRYVPKIEGDGGQLQLVIRNLIANAIESLREVQDRPRFLTLVTERLKGGSVRVKVTDSGIGWDPRSADKLFQPFFTTKNGGMGIGLSLSRAIIEKHGGCLDAAVCKGPGAEFSFTIPTRRPKHCFFRGDPRSIYTGGASLQMNNTVGSH